MGTAKKQGPYAGPAPGNTQAGRPREVAVGRPALFRPPMRHTRCTIRWPTRCVDHPTVMPQPTPVSQPGRTLQHPRRSFSLGSGFTDDLHAGSGASHTERSRRGAATPA
ncbi:hypothetical protein SF06_04180 [Pseudomonas flexibilis]|nr:hypothetical protein SF06_04180 [Pseudomonas flexibilis]